MVENDSEMAILDCIASGTLSDVKNVILQWMYL